MLQKEVMPAITNRLPSCSTGHTSDCIMNNTHFLTSISFLFSSSHFFAKSMEYRLLFLSFARCSWNRMIHCVSSFVRFADCTSSITSSNRAVLRSKSAFKQSLVSSSNCSSLSYFSKSSRTSQRILKLPSGSLMLPAASFVQEALRQAIMAS